MRESVLKNLEKKKLALKEDDSASTIGIKRAKTVFQVKRNGFLKKAADVLKKDSRAQGKTVSIEWLVDGSKDRRIKLDGDVVLEQKP